MDEGLNPTIHWSSFECRVVRVLIAATIDGLCYVSTRADSFQELSSWVRRWVPGGRLQNDEQRLVQYKEQVREYMQGRRTQFTLPLDLRGTAFQREVWQALDEIAYGEQRTYTEVANKLGKPSSVRAVAAAIGANPVLLAVPCHRVIGKDGKLTGYRDGLALKRELLELERRAIDNP